MPESIGSVQTQFAGIDPLILADVPERSGVRWANAAGFYDDTVAESWLGLLLAVNHQHKAASFDTRDEIAERTRYLTPAVSAGA